MRGDKKWKFRWTLERWVGVCHSFMVLAYNFHKSDVRSLILAWMKLSTRTHTNCRTQRQNRRQLIATNIHVHYQRQINKKAVLHMDTQRLGILAPKSLQEMDHSEKSFFGKSNLSTSTRTWKHGPNCFQSSFFCFYVMLWMSHPHESSLNTMNIPKIYSMFCLLPWRHRNLEISLAHWVG